MTTATRTEREFSVIGKRLPSRDALKIATGEAEYVTDVQLPGMLHGRVLRSPHPHARIVRIDTSRAERLPGVRAVVTAKDTPCKPFGSFLADELAFCLDKVRYVGDEVAAVAAIDEITAEEAVSLIDVEYEVLPGVFDVEEAMQPGAPVIHDFRPNNVADAFEREIGSFEEGLARAAFVAEHHFDTGWIHQAFLEPTITVASFDSTGRLTLWSCLHMPFLVRPIIADVLGIGSGEVRIIQPYIGGGFGGKYVPRAPFIAAFLARKARKPVRYACSREEEFVAGRPRAPLHIDLKMAVDREGKLCAKKARLVLDNGAYTDYGLPVMTAAATRSDCLYHCPNISVKAYAVYTNKTPTGCMRGFGNAEMHIAVESMMDILADGIGMAPDDMRLRNAVKTGDVTTYGWHIRSCGLAECVEKATAKTEYHRKRADYAAQRAESRPTYRGIGMGCMIHVCGNRTVGPYDFDGGIALVTVHDDGRVTLQCGEGDIGQGANTVLSQICAEVLGVRLEDVTMPLMDTDVTPYGMGIYASRVTTIGGQTVRKAAEDARAQLFAGAADLLEVSPDDLDAVDRKIFVKGSPERFVTLPQAVGRAFETSGPVLGRGVHNVDSVRVDKKTKHGDLSAAYSFGTQVVEVEVDAETGIVKVLSVLAANDVGRAINPMLIEGQLEGGISQGIGWALTESMRWQGGTLLNPSFVDYKLLLSTDMPKIDTIIVESIEPNGPFGAKGVGEPALIPTPPAILNAIANATGVRITRLPVDPEELLEGIRKVPAERQAGKQA